VIKSRNSNTLRSGGHIDTWNAARRPSRRAWEFDISDVQAFMDDRRNYADDHGSSS
jgi:hypothetical protein